MENIGIDFGSIWVGFWIQVRMEHQTKRDTKRLRTAWDLPRESLRHPRTSQGTFLDPRDAPWSLLGGQQGGFAPNHSTT